MIRAEGLGVTLAGNAVLADIDLNIASGTWTAVLGPNGAGKTTLLRAILGHQAHTGTLDVATRNIAYVPQRPELPAGMTISEYIALGRAPRDGWGRETSHGSQVRTDVTERLELGALANRQLAQLSGGEAQRAVLARALVQEPELMLLDEPTTALDPQHKVSILDELERSRAAGMTIVTALHDLNLALLYAPEALLLAAGRTVLTGPLQSIAQRSEFAAVFDNRIKVGNDEKGQPFILPNKG
jgi:iron complex transport system ATP-binding protein